MKYNVTDKKQQKNTGNPAKNNNFSIVWGLGSTKQALSPGLLTDKTENQ